MSVPSPAPTAAPREAAPIPEDQLDLDQRQALFDIQRAFGAIVDEVAKKAERDGKPSGLLLPIATPEATRTSRLMLIDGGRGSGKTSLMLTLLDRWARARGAGTTLDQAELLAEPAADAPRPAEDKSPWLNGTLARQVWALPILDFDPMPKGLPLIGWLLQALQAVVKRVEGHGCAPVTLNERRAHEQRGLTLSQTWARLHDEAVAAWEDAPNGARSFAERTDEDKLRLRSWAGFEGRFREAMDGLFAALDPLHHGLQGRVRVLVLPIDDVDMQVARSPELLHALRLLRHDRLVFLCTADRKLLVQTAQAKAEGELRALSGQPGAAAPDDGRRGAHSVGDLGEKLVQKMFPLAHVWHRPRFGLGAALARIATMPSAEGAWWQRVVAMMPEAFGDALTPEVDALWALTYRDMSDLVDEMKRHDVPTHASGIEGLDGALTAVDTTMAAFLRSSRSLPEAVQAAMGQRQNPEALRTALIDGVFGGHRAAMVLNPVPKLPVSGLGNSLYISTELTYSYPAFEGQPTIWADLALAWSRAVRQTRPKRRGTPGRVVAEEGLKPPHGTLIWASNRGPDRVERRVDWPQTRALSAKVASGDGARAAVNHIQKLLLAETNDGRQSTVSTGSRSKLVQVWLTLNQLAADSEQWAGPSPRTLVAPTLADTPGWRALFSEHQHHRFLATALIEPRTGLSWSARSLLMRAVLSVGSPTDVLRWLATALAPGGEVHAMWSRAARPPDMTWGLDQSERSLKSLATEPWWRIVLLSQWGAGAWAAMRFGRNIVPMPEDNMTRYMVLGEGEWSLAAFFRGPTKGYFPSPMRLEVIFSPGPELGQLWLQSLAADTPLVWEPLLWAPARGMTTATWVGLAWNLACEQEDQPVWRALLVAHPGGETLRYIGPEVVLGWEPLDDQGLRFAWFAKSAIEGELPPVAAGSALPGLLGIAMDLARGDTSSGAARISIAHPLVPGDQDLLRRVGCPRIGSFLKAERLRAWRPLVTTALGSGEHDRETTPGQVLEVARWLNMVLMISVNDAKAVPTLPHGLDESSSKLLDAQHRWLQPEDQIHEHMHEYSRWLKGLYPLLDGKLPEPLLQRWRTANLTSTASNGRVTDQVEDAIRAITQTLTSALLRVPEGDKTDEDRALLSQIGALYGTTVPAENTSSPSAEARGNNAATVDQTPVDGTTKGGEATRTAEVRMPAVEPSNGEPVPPRSSNDDPS